MKKIRILLGLQNHVLVDCISALPIYELTRTADSSAALDILANTHPFLSVKDCTFLANKGYDVKNIYNQVKTIYDGECIIPLNKRNTKYVTLLDDLRLSIDRNNRYIKSTYSLRTEQECYNSRFKNTGQEWVWNKFSVTNLNTLAHISLLDVAFASITMQESPSYRKLKSIKLIV